MAELPSEIIYDILSRMPIKSLAGFPTVSKEWRDYIYDHHLAIIHEKRSSEEPTPIIFIHLKNLEMPTIISFHITKSEEGITMLKAKTDPFSELEFKQLPYKYVKGSCNGLLYLSARHQVFYATSLVVINPLRKEGYNLPPLNRLLDWPHCLQEDSCGLGFDASTGTFKMVCVLSQYQRKTTQQNYYHQVNKKLCTMVHVLGTDSWQDIQQVPICSITGEGVFVHGCLYWLAYDRHNPSKFKGKIICFHVTTEKFGLIDNPKTPQAGGSMMYHLVNLHGELGYAYLDKNIDVWVRKRKEWVMYCHLDPKPPHSNKYIKVLGCWNKKGDLLIEAYQCRLFIYRLKSGVLDEVIISNFSDRFKGFIYMSPPSSLLSMRGISAPCYPIKY